MLQRNSGRLIVEQWGGTVEQCWLNSGTVIVEQCRWNSVVEQWNSNGGTVLVEQCGGTLRWNSVGGTAIVAQ